MNKQEYLDELLSAGQEYLDEAYEWDSSKEFDEVYPEMELVITGNDNGSYYCNRAKAEDAVKDAIWCEEIVELVRDLGFDGLPTDKGPEALDVLIRIALLSEIYSDLEYYWDEKKETLTQEEAAHIWYCFTHHAGYHDDPKEWCEDNEINWDKLSLFEEMIDDMIDDMED